MSAWFKLTSSIILTLTLSGCFTPTYTDSQAVGEKPATSTPFGEVSFHVYEAYTAEPPNCVAVLPFTNIAKAKKVVSVEDAEVVRKALYAHLSPQGKVDIELPRIDFVLKNLSPEQQNDFFRIGQKLGCDALVIGNVSEFESQFVGVYSKVAVNAQLKMIRAKTGEPLWEGKHLAETHGGSIPLSPIGIATGILDAARNAGDEQIFRVVDDLARRLVLTIPDNRIAIVEEPLSQLNMARAPAQQSIDDFLQSVSYKPLNEQKTTLIKAIQEQIFHGQNLRRVYEALIGSAPTDATANGLYADYLVQGGDYFKAAKYADTSLKFDPNNPVMHFLKGRIQIKLNDLGGADASILKAIALQPTNTKHLNGLGFLNSLRGQHERALAAYQMSVDLDPLNGYALYNMGVTFYNLSDLQSAWDYIYQASQAYVQSKEYGQVVKALADLKELKALGVVTKGEIAELEQILRTIQGNG